MHIRMKVHLWRLFRFKILIDFVLYELFYWRTYYLNWISDVLEGQGLASHSPIEGFRIDKRNIVKYWSVKTYGKNVTTAKVFIRTAPSPTNKTIPIQNVWSMYVQGLLRSSRKRCLLKLNNRNHMKRPLSNINTNYLLQRNLC